MGNVDPQNLERRMEVWEEEKEGGPRTIMGICVGLM